MNMNDGWFVKVMLVAGIAGAMVGVLIGISVGTAFPEAYGSTSNPVGFGIAAGLAQGLVVGVILGGFYVYWKTRLLVSRPAEQVIGSTKPKEAMSPLRTAFIAFGIAAVILVALGAYVFRELSSFNLRALPTDEGLRISYFGSRSIMVVGFADRRNNRYPYRLTKPLIYSRKSYGQVVPWSSIEPVNDHFEGPNKTTSREWEVIYVQCQTAQR